jgi:hypothetical protein
MHGGHRRQRFVIVEARSLRDRRERDETEQGRGEERRAAVILVGIQEL